MKKDTFVSADEEIRSVKNTQSNENFSKLNSKWWENLDEKTTQSYKSAFLETYHILKKWEGNNA